MPGSIGLLAQGINAKKVSSAVTFTFIKQGTPNTSAATPASPTLSSVGAGHLLILTFTNLASLGTASISGVTDSSSNTWVKAKAATTGGADIEIWYVASAAASAGTLTATVAFTGVTVASSGQCVLSEFSGQSVSPLDAVPTAVTGTSVTPSTPTGTQSVGNELFIGAVGTSTSSVTTSGPNTSGWSALGTSGNTSAGLGAYLISTDSSTHATTFTLGSSQPWAGIVASFKHA